MGNFLFQAATAMAYAWGHDMDFSLPSSTLDARHNPIYLQHLVNPKYNFSLPSVKIQENGHAYQHMPFQPSWREKNIMLDGYWQSERYFVDYRPQILEAFGYEWKQMEGCVSVHVRRTDYLRLAKKHPPVTLEWILKAMAMFPGYHFQFFSDDIKWCKEKFGDRKDCSFSEGNNEITDLMSMSWCEHHICSSSTFSWWGAWLNQNSNKKIVIPKHWFTEGWDGLDTSDIVPASWTKL